jgi:hypothetical protein
MQTFLFYLVSMMSQFGLTSLVNGIVDKVSYGIPGSISNAIGAIFDTEYDLVQAGGGLQDMMGSFINSNSDLYSGLWGNVENAYNAISIIGGSLLILYFFMGIADKLTKDRLTGYELLRSGIELMIALMVVIEGFNLFQGISTLTQEIYESLSGITISEWDTPDRNYQAFFKSNNYGGQNVSDWTDDMQWDSETKDDKNCKVHGWGGMTALFIPVIEVLLMALVTEVGCLIGVAAMVSRVIQMAVYMIFAPIATADMFHGGALNSQGFRYLKKFFAICLQGAVIYGIIFATSALQASFLKSTNLVSNPLFILIPGLIMVIMILKSQQFANDIIGV